MNTSTHGHLLMWLMIVALGCTTAPKQIGSTGTLEPGSTGDPATVSKHDDDAAASHTEGRGDMHPMTDRSTETIKTLLDTLERPGRDDYTRLANFSVLADGKNVEDDSRRWAERFFARDASPYRNRAERMTHHHTETTFDVLRHDYESAGLGLRVLETVELVWVIVKSGADELATMNHRDKLKRIDDIAHRILAMAGTRLGDDYQEHAFLWRFLFPQEIREGTRFSTDPGKDVDGMWSFADRVDGGIRNGRLYFLLFKRREPTDGRRIFLSAQHWFDGKCWEPYRNIKPRSAPHR